MLPLHNIDLGTHCETHDNIATMGVFRRCGARRQTVRVCNILVLFMKDAARHRLIHLWRMRQMSRSVPQGTLRGMAACQVSQRLIHLWRATRHLSANDKIFVKKYNGNVIFRILGGGGGGSAGPRQGGATGNTAIIRYVCVCVCVCFINETFGGCVCVWRGQCGAGPRQGVPAPVPDGCGYCERITMTAHGKVVP